MFWYGTSTLYHVLLQPLFQRVRIQIPDTAIPVITVLTFFLAQIFCALTLILVTHHGRQAIVWQYVRSIMSQYFTCWLFHCVLSIRSPIGVYDYAITQIPFDSLNRAHFYAQKRAIPAIMHIFTNIFFIFTQLSKVDHFSALKYQNLCFF